MLETRNYVQLPLLNKVFEDTPKVRLKYIFAVGRRLTVGVMPVATPGLLSYQNRRKNDLEHYFL